MALTRARGKPICGLIPATAPTTARPGEGPAIVPGAPADSPLLARVKAHDPQERMPPPEAKLPPLSDREIALLEQWIAEGALFDAHWSLLPIDRPAPPAVNDPAWPANPIDHFVLATRAARP